MYWLSSASRVRTRLLEPDDIVPTDLLPLCRVEVLADRARSFAGEASGGAWDRTGFSSEQAELTPISTQATANPRHSMGDE